MSDPVFTISDNWPKQSGWVCYLLGKPGGTVTVQWSAVEGTVPNAFWRLMQFLVLGVRWVRVSPTLDAKRKSE